MLKDQQGGVRDDSESMRSDDDQSNEPVEKGPTVTTPDDEGRVQEARVRISKDIDSEGSPLVEERAGTVGQPSRRGMRNLFSYFLNNFFSSSFPFCIC
jgi:hypothetical protein